MNFKDVVKITLEPNEVLLVRLPGVIAKEAAKKWSETLKAKLGTDRIIVYTGHSDIQLLKIQLQEKAINGLIDDMLENPTR